MKQSLMTGKAIYEQLKTLQSELDDLNKARSIIADNLGRDNTAYRLLNKQYEEKKSELRKTESIKYSDASYGNGQQYPSPALPTSLENKESIF